MENEIKIENNHITIDDFAKVEIMLGTIISAEEVEGSDKLYRLKVNFGEERVRNVFSGIKKYITTEELVGKQFPFVTNLEPRKMMGDYSEAMILAGSVGDDLALMSPTKQLPNGTKLR